MRSARAVVGLTLALVGLAFVAVTLAADRAALAEVAAAADARYFALGVALLLVQTVPATMLWRELLALRGARAGFATAYRLLYVSALGKYVPGKVWVLTGIALLAASAGLPAREAAFASGTTVALVADVGVLVGAVAYLGWIAVLPPALAGGVLVGLAVAPLAVALCVRGRARGACAAMGLASMCWLLTGASQWALARAVYPATPAHAAPLLASAAFGWIAGQAAVLPAGLGVREAAQVLVLTGVLPPASAAAIALVTRAGLVAADLLAAAAAWILTSGRPQPAPGAANTCTSA